MRVEAVAAEDVRPLRGSVLRPGQAPDELVYPGDDHADALHAAIRGIGAGGTGAGGTGAIVGVATVAPEGHPRDPRPGDWRLRGMATAPGARGRGLGAALLAACLHHARDRGGARVWCNARVTAEGFYVRAGFVAEGARFELPDIGPHVVMAVSLRG